MVTIHRVSIARAINIFYSIKDTNKISMKNYELISSSRSVKALLIAAVAFFSIHVYAANPNVNPEKNGSLPSFQLGKAESLSLSQAASLGLYSGSNTTSTGFVTRGDTAEIRDLASSLALLSSYDESDSSFKSDYAKHAYAYVYSEIEPEFRFGLSKGALGALLDKSGTPFDQVQLLKEILDQKNIPSTYTIGEVTLNGEQFYEWTGINTASEACQLLANGGIPANINGTSSATCAISGAVSVVTFVHPWLSVTGIGELDPSFKKMNYYAPLDLIGMTGYTRTGLINSGVSSPNASGLNPANLSNQLSNYARSYYNNVKASHEKEPGTKVLGGVEIAYKKINEVAISLPYSASPKISSLAAIPDRFRTSLRISLKYQNTETFNNIFYADEIYGRHLSFEPVNHPIRHDVGSCDMMFDGVKIDTQNYIFRRMELTVNHPYLAKQPGSNDFGTYMDEKAEFLLNCQLTTALVHSYGKTGDDLKQNIVDSVQERRATILSGSYGHPNYRETKGLWGNPNVAQAMYEYLVENSRQFDFVGSISKTIIERHHVLGLSTQNPQTHFGQPNVIEYQGLKLDLHSRVSASRRAVNAPSDLALGRTLSWLSATTEGGAVKRVINSLDTSSAAERFGWAADKGISFLTLAPYSSAPALEFTRFPNPSAHVIFYDFNLVTDPPFKDKVRAKVNEYLSQGYAVTLPVVSVLGPGEFPWEYVFSIDNSPDYWRTKLGLQYGGAFYAEKTSTGEYAHILMDVSNFSKGGGPGIDAPKVGGSSLIPPKADERQTVDHGVQKNTGDVSYTFSNLISLGSGSFPYALNVDVKVKTKRGEPNFTNYYAHGYGNVSSDNNRWWRVEQKYEIAGTGSATLTSDAIKLLGVRSPLEAAPSVAAIVAMLDISSSSESKVPQLNSLINRWLDRQATDNTVRISSPNGSEEFVQHFNGSARFASFKPSPGIAQSLTITGTLTVEQTGYGVGDRIPGSDNPGFEYLQQKRKKLNNLTFVRFLSDRTQETFAPMHVGTSNEWHPLVSIKNTSDVEVSYEYNIHKYLTKMSNSLGRAIYFKHTIAPHHKLEICSTSDACSDSSQTVVIQETLDGVEITKLDGNKWKAQLDNATVAGSRPVSGWVLKAIYSPQSTTHPIVRYNYDKSWRVTGIDLQNQPGQYWNNAYRWALLPGYAVVEVDAVGGKKGEYFDAAGNVVAQQDAKGVQTYTAYDAWRRPIDTRTFDVYSLSVIPGSIWSNSLPEHDVYAGSYLQRTVKNYDNQSNIISEKLHPNASESNKPVLVTSRTYHSTFNKLLTETYRYEEGGSGATAVTNTYNSKGLLEASTTAAGLVTNYSYHANGLPMLINEGGRRHKIIEYDNYGNLTKFTTQTPSATEKVIVQAGYLNAIKGDVTSVIDPLGRTSTATYDGARRIKTLRGPLGSGADYIYDTAGRLEQVKTLNSGSFLITRAQYNPLGWMTALIDPAGDTQSFSYDARGLTITTTDGELRKKHYTYDVNGRMTCIRDGWGTPLVRTYKHLTYNPLGQITAYNSAKSDTNSDCTPDNSNYRTTLAYDAYGQLERTTFPNASYESLSYDSRGNIDTKRTRKGEVIDFDYDNASRLKTKVVPASVYGSVTTPGYTVSYTYDEFNLSKTVTQGTSVLSYTYDYLDRMKTAVQNGRTLSYQYDSIGNRTRLTWPDGYAIDYTYDALNRMDLIKHGTNTVADFDYDTLSRNTKITYGNGAVANLGYEADNDLNSLNLSFPSTPANINFVYGYNAAAQLITESASNRAYHWRPKATAEATYSVNNLNQYINVAGASVSYDSNGNTARNAKGNYFYDAENKLQQVNINAGGPMGALIAGYGYDGMGRRSQKTVTTSSTTFITQYLSDGDHEVAEYDGTGSGSLVARYIYGNNVDDIIARVEANGNVSYAHRNRLGSVIAVSNASGTVTAANQYNYSPYGEAETAAGTGAAGFPYRYTGRRIDPETGMYYYRARYYDPYIGRFLQTDPIGYEDQMNLYAYVGNDPVNKIDPMGMYDVHTAMAMADAHIFLRDPANREALGNVARDVYVGAVDAIKNGDTTKLGNAAATVAVVAVSTRASKIERHHVVPHRDSRAAQARANMKDNGIDPKTEKTNLVDIPGDKHDITKRDSYVTATNERIAAQDSAEAIKTECCKIAKELVEKTTEQLDEIYPRK